MAQSMSAPIPKEEMWFLTLAKSKVMRFAALTCELVLFFGGLWITLTVSNPEAKTWAGGTINAVFLTLMGFAIDAAMPESWLHVVGQHLTGKRMQEHWSRSVAIAMSLLFIGNIAYSFLTAGETRGGIESGMPTDAQGWILLMLMVTRISVGFVYITVRECQGFIARHEATPAQLPAPPVDVQVIIDLSMTKLADMLRGEVRTLLAVKSAIDYEAIAEAIVPLLVNRIPDNSLPDTGQMADTTGHQTTEPDTDQADMEPAIVGQDIRQPDTSYETGQAATSTGQAAKIIDLTDRRTGRSRQDRPTGHRPGGQQSSGQSATESDRTGQDISQPDTGHQIEAVSRTSDSALTGQDTRNKTGQTDRDLVARIVAYQAEHPGATRAQLAAALGTSERTVRRKIADMRAAEKTKASGQ